MTSKKRRNSTPIKQFNLEVEWIRFLVIFTIIMVPLYVGYFYAQQQISYGFSEKSVEELQKKGAPPEIVTEFSEMLDQEFSSPAVIRAELEKHFEIAELRQYGLTMLSLIERHEMLQFVKNFSAQLTAKFLFLTGVETKVLYQHPYYGDTFVYGDFMPIRVIYECTGIFMMLIFLSGIIAYRSTMLEKLIGLVVCIPGIYLTNVLRLIFLGLIGHHAPQHFDFFHNYVWYALFSIILIGMWLFWIDIVIVRESDS